MTSHASSSATINKNIPHLVKKIKGFPVNAKSFRNNATYQKLWGGVPSTPPPPSCTIVGLWFYVYVRGLSGSFKIWQVSGWFCMWLHFFSKASFTMDTKGLYCVTKGNICFSSLLFCLGGAAFLLWALLLIAIFLSKLCCQPLFINRFLKSEILPQRSLLVGFSRLLVCQIHFNNWWMIRGKNVYTGRFPFKMYLSGLSRQW